MREGLDRMPNLRKRVLVVDDSELIVSLLRLLLGSAFDVTTARDGEEGVSCALSQKPDLILMDLQMPRLDGVSALRRLRARAETRDTPVILLSARADPESRQRALEAGCDDFLTKPFRQAELVGRIRERLGA